jgi:insulysin
MPEIILKNGILVSEKDNRIYENFTLENGLEVLLVIDNTLKRSAACLNISAGYYYDEIPGTAHLLEHLLFMGTKTNPDIPFGEFLKTSLGEMNAVTGAERTIFYFECTNEEFDKVLKRFSEFFYEPLLSCEDIDLQIEIIEKEKILLAKEDIRRVIQVLKENIENDHPYKKFSIGSEETLSSEDIYTKVIDFFEKHYFANFMKLVVVSRDDIKDSIIRYFSKIRGLEAQEIKNQPKNVPLKLANKVFKLRPYKNTNKIFFVWPLPETISDFLEKPFQYLTRMLTDISEGTPAFLLRNWIKEVQNFSIVQKDLTILIISITLNDKSAVKYIREITAIFLEYIRILKQKGIKNKYFEEMKTVSMKEFFFRSDEKVEVFEFAKEIAENMLLFPKQYYIIGPYIYEKFDKKKIERYIDLLSPDNMQIFILSHEAFEKSSSNTKVEKYFGIEYTSEDVKDFLIDIDYITGVVRNKEILKELQVLSDLSIPEENELIPENFELKPRDTEEPMMKPVIIENNEFIRVWYKQDNTYLQPFSFHFIEFSSPVLTENILSNMIARIFVELIKDQLKGFIYKSNIAGVSIDIEFVSNTIEIHVSGFSDKQHHIIDVLIYNISRLTKFKDEWTLERLKRVIKTEYFSSFLQPYEQGIASISLLVEGFNSPSTDQELRIIESIQTNDIRCFVSRFLSTASLELFASGNVTREETLYLSEIIKKNVKPRYFKIPHEIRIVKIPQFRQTQKRIIFEVRNEIAESEFAVVNYYQLGLKTIENSALIDIIENRIYLNLFQELREKEIKSYFTFTSHIDNAKVLGFVIVVQTNDKTPQDIEKKVDLILEKTLKEFEEMDSQTLGDFLRNLADEKIGVEKDLQIESQKLWNQIRFPYYHEFEKSQKKAEIIKSLDRKSIIDFLKDNFIKDTKRLVTIRVLNKNQRESEETSSEILIKDLKIFKNSQESYFMFF